MDLHLTMLKFILAGVAVPMHHFSGLDAPLMRSKGTVSSGLFNQLGCACFSARYFFSI